MSFVSFKPFPKVQQLPPYVFQEVAALVSAAARGGRDVINLSLGSPDLPPARMIRDALHEAVEMEGASRYSVSAGIDQLRRSCAAYYERRFGVVLDHETEIVSTLGSKNAFATFAQAVAGPSDAVLVPSPSYPIHQWGFEIAGARTIAVPPLADDSFFRAAEEALRQAGGSALALVVSYPGNPTGEVAGKAFLREVVRFARRHDLLLLSDLAYAEIYFAEPPHSILEIDGAKDIAIEFTSVSKTFNMAGWRVGFAVGNDRLVGALKHLKSYLDYGNFTPIQKAAAIALDHSEALSSEIRRTYLGRRDAFCKAASNAGWHLPAPEAGMFVWAKVPTAEDSLSFCKRMVTEAGVALSPGSGFGDQGEGYVRAALVASTDELEQAARRLAAAIG
jgi:alanine-synthesizing transaminase